MTQNNSIRRLLWRIWHNEKLVCPYCYSRMKYYEHDGWDLKWSCKCGAITRSPIYLGFYPFGVITKRLRHLVRLILKLVLEKFRGMV